MNEPQRMAYRKHAYSNHDQYLESELLTADPVKLVRMLYRAAIEATTAARHHLAAGAIRERSRQITKAWEILQELFRSLDADAGGEISVSLGQLYPYMQRRLLDANMQQADEPLAEVEQLLTILFEGWSSISAETAGQEYPSESLSCTY